MARYLVVTTIHSVVDDPTVLNAELAQTNAEAKITLSATGTVVASGITGSDVRSATSETNAQLVSKGHGPETG